MVVATTTATTPRPPGLTRVPVIAPGIELLTSPADAGEAYEVLEYTRDVGQGPMPHVHRHHDEAFYVLEGQYTIWRGDQKIDARRGTFVHIPRNTRHYFKAASAGARVLILAIPAGLANFVVELARMVATGVPESEARAILAHKYDNHPVQ